MCGGAVAINKTTGRPGATRTKVGPPLTPSPLPIVALFKNAQNQRSPMPPSSFPGGLQPVTSGANHRISRTDMDFEQALRSEGTVKLAEGFDINSLGANMSPAPSPRSFTSKPTPPAKDARTPRARQPPTPVVVPPTPGSPAVVNPSSARLAAPSPSSSSGDIFYDAEDTEMQTKRRSLYRSPGTSSSPDLATLLRKAKERGGIIGSHHKKDKRQEAPPPPLPTMGLGLRAVDHAPATRQRSSTSSSPAPPPILQTSFDADNGAVRSSNSTDDWVFASPRSRTASRGDSGDKVNNHYVFLPTPSLTFYCRTKRRSGPRRAPFSVKCGEGKGVCVSAV